MDLNVLWKIFIMGIVIIIGAIIFNLIEKSLGIMTWYDFLTEKRKIDFLSGIFMFIIYPFVLGLLGYIGWKIFN